jgi:uncharacterized membrane protein
VQLNALHSRVVTRSCAPTSNCHLAGPVATVTRLSSIGQFNLTPRSVVCVTCCHWNQQHKRKGQGPIAVISKTPTLVPRLWTSQVKWCLSSFLSLWLLRPNRKSSMDFQATSGCLQDGISREHGQHTKWQLLHYPPYGCAVN